MYIAHGGPESTDDPPTPPTPVTAPKAPALKPLEELLAGSKDEEDSLVRRRALLDAQLPPLLQEDPEEPATEPTQRDTATPMSAQDLDNTPRTHRGPLDDRLQTPDLASLRASRPNAPEPAPEGLWARLKAWLGL